MMKWHAVDLDGTLAKKGMDSGMPVAWSPYAIGEPIPAAVDRVKGYLKDGDQVSIFTARVDTDDPELKMQVTLAIQMWCQKNLGQILEVTCIKSAKFTDFEDDRASTVERNTGKLLSTPKDGDEEDSKPKPQIPALIACRCEWCKKTYGPQS
jgi:hypothetical protein